MKVFTYSEARQNLAKLLAMAQNEEVEIRRRDGSVFSLRSKRQLPRSPFDVPGVDAKISAEEIVGVIRAGRER